MVHWGSHSSWVSSPFGGPSPPYTSVLCWVSWRLISCWVPSLSLRLLPFVFSSCWVSLLCVLPLPLFWPSLGFFATFFCFSLLCASVESQFLRYGVLPPGRVSSVGVFVHSFPWCLFLSTSLGVFLVCSDFSPYFSQYVGYYLLRWVFLAVSILLLVAVWLSRLHLVCFCSSFWGSLSPLRVLPTPSFSRCCFYCPLSVLLLLTFLFYLI